MTATPDLAQLKEQLRRDYDPYAQITIQENLDDLANRRESMPISFTPQGGGCWIITSYDDISSVLRRNNHGFVSYPNEPPTDLGNFQGKRNALIPIEIDGPLHREYRNLLEPLFSPKAVDKLAPTLRASANELIDGFIERGKVDFGMEFALPFPGATVMAIMGWPVEDMVQLSNWADVIMHGVYGGTEEETAAARAEAGAGLHTYLMGLMAERRTQPPREDITSLMLDAVIDGRKLTDDEIFDQFLLMVFAGLDTVQSAFTQSMVYFARNQHKWDDMFSSPERFDNAIEEMLRWTTMPVPTRTVVEDDIEVAGITMVKGEKVHAPLGAANRDPKYFPNPDEVDFSRDRTKPHLAFGLGPHRCVGAHLARLELAIGFEELRRRMPVFQLDPEFMPEEHLGLAWGINNVHFTFPPGKRDN